MDDILQPLVNQPGETFEYGVGMFAIYPLVLSC